MDRLVLFVLFHCTQKRSKKHQTRVSDTNVISLDESSSRVRNLLTTRLRSTDLL